MLHSWKTTLVGGIMLAVGAYYALTGGNEAITALFITNGIGLIVAKDFNA